MDNENSDLAALCEYLKDIADRSNAGRAYIEFTRENGDVFRVEYKPSKKA